MFSINFTKNLSREFLIPNQAILPWLITSFFPYNDDGYMSDKDFKTVEPPTSGHPEGEDLVVAYESRTTGGLFRVEVLTFLVFGREFIACNFSTLSKFSCTLCSIVHKV